MEAPTDDSRGVLRERELLSLLLALLVVLAITILSFRAWKAYNREREQAVISRQIVSATNDLLSSLKDAETGQRGYLLTGEDRYLQPYRQALGELQATLDSLTRFTAISRPDHAQRIEALKPFLREKLDELATTIRLHAEGRQSEALAVVQTDHGREVMDQIRERCAGMQRIANARLAQFSEDARSSANRIGLISIFGSGGLFLLLVFSTVTIRRITRRRQQLIRDLRESEAQTTVARDWLRTTIASIGDAVIATDAAGKVSFLNRAAESITGWSQEQAEGQPLEKVFVISNEDTGATVENPVTKVLREGRIVGLANHTCLTSKEGRRIPIDDSAAPIRAAGGDIDGVVLVFRDVTDRKEAEKAVEKSIERFRMMADNAPVLIWMADAGGRFTWFNKPWLDFSGRTMEQELGAQELDDWGPTSGPTSQVHPEDLDRWRESLKDAYREHQPFQLEFRLQRKAGDYRWLLNHATPLHDGAGDFAGYIGSCVDITERIGAEVELRRANEDLNQFAFAASHDLQEPLRMITSYSQLLVKGYRGQLDGEAAVSVDFITEGATRMRELLADLLAYTQVTADGYKPTEFIELDSVVQKAIANLSKLIEESHAVVTTGPLPRLHAEEAHFVQVFQNLIGNGIKDRSTAAPQIHISASNNDGIWRVAVSDNGIGIAPQYHQRIFGVFKRLHGKVIPGTGIGLAICQRVVERYGGRIWVESNMGQGSTFYFTLPEARGGIR